MQGPVIFVALPAAAEPLRVILELGLHYPAYGDDIPADAGVNQVVPDLTVDGFWKFTRINVLHVIFNLLNPDALEE